MALLLALALLGCCGRVHADCPVEQPIAGGNERVHDLDTFTFWPAVKDGRVWFVELYTDGCRACKRLAHDWAQLAEAVEDHQEIAIGRWGAQPARGSTCSHRHASVRPDPTHSRLPPCDRRLNCDRQTAALCESLFIVQTPSLKVFYLGEERLTYQSPVLHLDMLLPFILKMARDLTGSSDQGSASLCRPG